MRTAIWMAAVWVGMSVGAANGQSAADVQRSLERSVEGRHLPIRDFLGEPVIRYTWADGELDHDPEKTFTLGIFETESIRVDDADGKAGHVTITGKRWTLLKNSLDATGALSKDAVPVRFDVNLVGADRATIEGLASLLFFPDVASALKAVPGEVAVFLPTNPLRAAKGRWVRMDGEWKQVDAAAAGFTPPKVVFAPEPEFPEGVKKYKPKGSVQICVSVSADGLVAGAWLVQGIGLGVDEEAEKAALAYKFNPATVDGKAVGAAMTVEINFDTY